MTTKFALLPVSLLGCCAVALISCAQGRPPQTGFYCVDIPDGKSAEAGRFIQTVADRLGFKVSEAEFTAPKGGPPHHVWEVYGGGVSMFADTAMKDGKADRYGNSQTTFNPNRLGLNVVKTGLLQSVSFERVVAVAKEATRQLGWRFTEVHRDSGCAT